MTDILPSEAGAVNKTLRLRKDKEFCLVPLPDSAGHGAFLWFLDLASFRPVNSPGALFVRIAPPISRGFVERSMDNSVRFMA